MAVKKNKKEETTDLVRVEKITLKKVRDFVIQSKQTIGGFYTLAAEEKLQKDKK